MTNLQDNFERGILAMDQGDFDGALQLLQQVANPKDKYAAVQLRIGECLHQLGRKEEAKAPAQRAYELITAQPDCQNLQKLMGRCRLLFTSIGIEVDKQ